MVSRSPTSVFSDFSITRYEQYKLYDFLITSNSLDTINTKITNQINDINNNYFFGERLLFLAEKGLGKTSTLFFIKKKLESHNIKVYYFTRLIEDITQIHSRIRESLTETLKNQTLVEKQLKIEISNLFKTPTYILIDFPDSFETPNLKKFLIYLWELITDKNYNKINLIFALNDSHHKKAIGLSEIFGKFTSLSLFPFDRDETQELINSRLKLLEDDFKNPFTEEIYDIVFDYSKGVPRSIICACNLLFSSLPITKQFKTSEVEKLFREEFINKLIDDKIDDKEMNRISKLMIYILKNDFNGIVKSQQEYVEKVREVGLIGSYYIYKVLNKLDEIGIIKQHKSGLRRHQKTIALVGRGIKNGI